LIRESGVLEYDPRKMRLREDVENVCK